MILDTINLPKKIKPEMLDSIVNHANEVLDLSDLDELVIRFKAQNDACGYFDGFDDDSTAGIEVNTKNTIDEIVTTIFHELVHEIL